MSQEREQRPRLPKGVRIFIRDRKAEARKDGGDWTEVLSELRLSDLLTLVKDSGVGNQRFRNALKTLDIDNIDSTRCLLAVSEEMGSDHFPYENERLLDATQQALRKHTIELERKNKD